MPCRASRPPSPVSWRRSTVPCSSTPARTRSITYCCERFSMTTDSMPSRWSRCASSRPAGPAPTMPTCVRISDTFDDHGVSLSVADAHSAERVAPAGPLQLIDRGREEACFARAERMAQSDGAPLRIDAWIVIGDVQLAKYCEALGGESFVQFDDVDPVQSQSRFGEYARGGGDRPH